MTDSSSESQARLDCGRLHNRAKLLEWLTVTWNVVEAIVAVGAGIHAGSTALIAFGADSTIEFISAVGLLWRLYRAGPADSSQQHERAERQALYIVSATFLLLGVYVLIESTLSLIQSEGPEESVVGLVLSVVSLLVMPVLAIAKQRTGRRLNSRALQADAIETWVCSYLSLALLAGIGLNTWFGWWWSDSVAALAMLPVVFWQAKETFEEAGNGVNL